MRIAVLSDIHSNAFAMDSVLKHIRTQSVDSLWFLGDVVGYGPDPVATLEFLKEKPDVWVPGNHDAGLVGVLSEFAFNNHAQAALDANFRLLHTQRNDLLTWFQKSFPAEEQWVRNKTVDDFHFTLVHGALRRTDGPKEHLLMYLRPWMKREICLELHQLQHNLPKGVDAAHAYLLVGHTHVPCFCYWDQKKQASRKLGDAIHYPSIAWGKPLPLPNQPSLINPGSVGQPRDGDARASYALLDTGEQTITFHRVEYPIRKTKRAMAKQNFPVFLRKRLERAHRSHQWPENWSQFEYDAITIDDNTISA